MPICQYLGVLINALKIRCLGGVRGENCHQISIIKQQSLRLLLRFIKGFVFGNEED